MYIFTEPLAKLIEELQKLPGIGAKTAQRLAFHLIKQPEEEIKKLASALIDAYEKIKYCSVCSNLSSQDPCEICTDSTRDHEVVCVVADPRDLIAIEKTKQYKGMYHILQGLISPIDGLGPEQLKIKELLKRLQSGKIREIILALNPTIEGEATILYLSKLLKPSGIKITKIAFGLPMGTDLEYADEITLIKALEGRQEI